METKLQYYKSKTERTNNTRHPNAKEILYSQKQNIFEKLEEESKIFEFSNLKIKLMRNEIRKQKNKNESTNNKRNPKRK